MKKLLYKNKKGTDKELPHTDVYEVRSNGKDLYYLGYIIVSANPFNLPNAKWHFVSRVEKLLCFHGHTKKEMKDIVSKQVNRQTVEVRTYFGKVQTLIYNTVK